MSYGMDFKKGDKLVCGTRVISFTLTKGKVYIALSDATQEVWTMSNGGDFYCQPKVLVENDKGDLVERNCTHFKKVSGNE